MKCQPEIHHRRSIRLKEYDYSQANAYFVTICVQNKQCLLGEIQDGKMLLNQAGLMTLKWYQELSNKFTNLQCDEFVCMPNHIHFIVNITVGAHLHVRPDKPQKCDLSTIIQWYKTMTTNQYIRAVKDSGWQPFNGKLWQRNYWERVVRNESELTKIRDYIQTNPKRWEQDKLYTDQPEQTVGADLRVRPINPMNKINPAVGAHLRVRPNVIKEHKNINQRQTHRSEKAGQTHRSKNAGQTHRSAPTTNEVPSS